MRMIITSFRNKRFTKNLMQNPTYLKGDKMKDIDVKKVCEILNEVIYEQKMNQRMMNGFCLDHLFKISCLKKLRIDVKR